MTADRPWMAHSSGKSFAPHGTSLQHCREISAAFAMEGREVRFIRREQVKGITVRNGAEKG
jgi:hypothetical protein